MTSATSFRLRAVVIGFLLSATGFANLLRAQAPTTLAIAGRNNDAVSIASDANFVAVSWGASLAGAQDVFVATSRNSGTTFSAPVRVNATIADARVGGEQPPHVVLVPHAGKEPGIVVVWTAKRPEGGRLLTARSDDGGATFGATTVVPGADAAGGRGWESVTVDAAGKVYVMWLDHRGLVAPMQRQMSGGAGGPAMPKPDPVEQAGKSQLFIASLDGSTPPRAITNGVCYCCKTSITTAADGRVYGVWRHVFAGDLRDIAFTSSRDKGRTFSTPVRVSEDHWEYDGCPDNGPSIAVDATNRVHVAWPSPADVKDARSMAIWYAMSSNGRTFSPRVRIPTDANAGHLQILAERDGSVVVTWEEMAGPVRTLKIARGTPDASGRIAFRIVGSPTAGKYPAMAMTPSGALMAYTVQQNGSNVIAVSRVAR